MCDYDPTCGINHEPGEIGNQSHRVIVGKAGGGKTLAAAMAAMEHYSDLLCPRSFWRGIWESLQESRFIWLDILLAVLIFTVLPALILGIIPWVN